MVVVGAVATRQPTALSLGSCPAAASQWLTSIIRWGRVFAHVIKPDPCWPPLRGRKTGPPSTDMMVTAPRSWDTQLEPRSFLWQCLIQNLRARGGACASAV